MKKRMFPALVCLVLLAAFLSVPARAIDPVELSRTVTLTVDFRDGDDALPGARFNLYRAADMGRFAEFTLAGDFADYPVEIDGLDADGWKTAAVTLANYALRDGLTPLDSGVTDREGRLTFPTGETVLTPGLYLLLGGATTVNGYRYTPAPLLISLPNRAAEEHQWTYDVTVSPKFDRTTTGGGGGSSTVDRKVLKVWKDGGSEDRPESIQVQLLKDGKVADTVTLSAKNNWRHTWKDLSSKSNWQVVEKETPEGYTVTVTREGITFVMTNTLKEPAEPDNPGEPKEPDKDIPDEPIPGGPGETPPEEPVEIPNQPVPGGPALPQTGQLWWPVPVLACAGLALFLLGWVRREQAEHGQ